jgi:transcriptional regulator with XRE-family HTH domain
MIIIRQARLVGLKVRSLRKKRHLTQAELAIKIGVQQSDLSRMEKGEYRVSLDTLFRILQVFEMTMAEFFDEVIQGGVSTKDQEILSDFHTLAEEDQKEVREFIHFKKMQEKGKTGNEFED